MIVLDEVLWALSKKCGLPLADGFELLDRVLPLLGIVPLDSADHTFMKETALKYGLKPSDSLHLASMARTGAEYIASEDKDFDKVSYATLVGCGKSTRFNSVVRIWLLV